MVAAFIKKHGVTECPASGSPELTALHLERERARREGDWSFGGWKRKRKQNRATA